MSDEALSYLRELPSNYRWKVARRRTWLFLTLEEKHWYGWKRIDIKALRPDGLGMNYAVSVASEEIKDVWFGSHA